MKPRKMKQPQWARDLERQEPFDRIVSLMAASRLLREAALEEKKRLMRDAGWTRKLEPEPFFVRGELTYKETWTTPDGSRTYWIFDMAWHRYVASLRRKTIEPCLGCIGRRLGFKAPHTHVKR